MDFIEEKIIPAEEKDKLYFGWIDGEMKKFIQEKCPSLLEKLDNLHAGQGLALDGQEKSFLVDCVDSGVPLISNFISGVAGKIWGGTSVHWKDKKSGVWMQENLAAAFWHNFHGDSSGLIDFYLNTTKAEAEKQCQEFNGGTKYGPETKIQ